MTPSGRAAATIEVLEASLGSAFGIEHILARYFRHRRYAGSKDRAAVAAQVYAVVRHRSRLDWWLGRIGMEPGPRTRLLAELLLGHALAPAAVLRLFDGSSHGPSTLCATEQRFVTSLAGHALEHADMPFPVRFECPEWIAARLRPVYGADSGACLSALAGEARFDIRINPVSGTGRDEVRSRLAAWGLDCEPTPYSPLGLRAAGRRRIDGLGMYRDGTIEVQDEGAQLASLLVGAQPGMQVADLCAGAGGKTLVLGAMMANKGRVLAADISAARLQRASHRISRAGLHNVERRVLRPERDRYLGRWAGRFDRVLADVPCTGIGVWRRHPETRYRYEERDLEGLLTLQDRILATAASLTRPGGRLVYVTCSLLREENEDRVHHLLQARRDFELVPIAAVWQQTVVAHGGAPCPETGPMLRLSPVEHGTDGFFVAVLRRIGGP